MLNYRQLIMVLLAKMLLTWNFYFLLNNITIIITIILKMKNKKVVGVADFVHETNDFC